MPAITITVTGTREVEGTATVSLGPSITATGTVSNEVVGTASINLGGTITVVGTAVTPTVSRPIVIQDEEALVFRDSPPILIRG